jgi:hypothetical protein
MLSETDIINMLHFFIDNIFAMFGGLFFQQTVGIIMGSNCALRFADLFLYSYETDFMQGFLKKTEKKLAPSFNFTFRYIDDVLSLNNSRFGDRSVSYLVLHLDIGSEGRLRTKHYDKRDDFNFPIDFFVNFPFICRNIPAASAHGVYISQLIRYSRACGSYQVSHCRVLLLTSKLPSQGFLLVKLKS